MTFFYDLNKRLADLDRPQTQTLTESTVAEKIEPPIKTDPSERGKYKGQNIDDLKRQMATVKDKMAAHKERGEKVPDALRGKFSELTFAIRAKQAHGGKWGKIKEGEVDEGPEVFKLKADAARKAGAKEFEGPDGKTYPVKEGNDGNLANNAKPYDKVTRGDVIAGRLGKDEMGGKAKKIKEQGVAEGSSNRLVPGKFYLLGKDKKVFTDPGAPEVPFEFDDAKEVLDFYKYRLTPYQYDDFTPVKFDGKNFQKIEGVAEGRKEDWDAMLAGVEKRRNNPKKGEVTHGYKHDITQGTTDKNYDGRIAIRRKDAQGMNIDPVVDPEGREKEKQTRAGAPKKNKAPERVTAKAYKHKHGRMEEGMEDEMPAGNYETGERGEYDREGDMAKEQLHTIEQAAQELKSILSDEENLPEWVQSKITKAMDYVDTARDYMLAQHDDRVNERELSKAERKEKERVFKKDMKPQMADFKKRYGKEQGENVAHAVATNIAKGVKMGKKKKEESVDETTTSGSVAVSDAAPKGKKGVTFGKGIYDSVNREVEKLIAESMSINASMNMDQHGGPSRTLTVNATDDDAEKLAALLMMAGIGPQDGGCPSCGAASCGCDQQMDEAYGDTDATENQPDWPTAQEGSDDALQYSGGLNKPKVTGQTTVPVTGVQPAQSPLMYENSDLVRMLEMAGMDATELEPYRHTMKETDAEKSSVVKKEPGGFSATAPAGKRLSVTLGKQPLKPSDVKVKDKDMDENLVVTPAPSAGSTAKPAAPSAGSTTKPTPAPTKPGPTMGTIKGGVWTADPPKKGERGVPMPTPISEPTNERIENNLMRELANFKGKR